MELSDRAYLALGYFGRILSPNRRFTVIAPARSGSELLVSLLNSHPGIRCDGELCKYAREHPARYVDGHAVKARLRGVPAYGWKLGVTSLLYAQDRYGGAENWLQHEADLGRHIVFLWRRDLVNQAVSFLTAQKSGVFHVWSADGSHATDSYVVEADRILARVVNQEEELDWINGALDGLPRLELIYEEDLADPSRHQATADRVFEYLGLPPAEVTTDLLRHPVASGLDRLANADDVRSLLSMTRFKSLLQSEG
jgi:LPS sulfotransferase NodH